MKAVTVRYFLLFCLVGFQDTLPLFAPRNTQRFLSPDMLKNNASRRTADKLLTKVYYRGGSSIICASDLRPSIDGVPKTFKQVLLDKLMILEAQTLKPPITVTEAEIDRHLALIQKEHNLKLEDVLRLFDQMGYTADEGREQLRTMKMIDSVLDRMVRSKISITRNEVEKYDNEHPKIVPGSYTISQAFFPFDVTGSKEEQRKKLEAQIKDASITKAVSWDKPIELESQSIAADKQFIKDLPVDSIVRVEETPQGVKLLKLVAKKPEGRVPVKELEQEIMGLLGREKFETVFNEFQRRLISKAHFNCTDESIKAELASL